MGLGIGYYGLRHFRESWAADFLSILSDYDAHAKKIPVLFKIFKPFCKWVFVSRCGGVCCGVFLDPKVLLARLCLSIPSAILPPEWVLSDFTSKFADAFYRQWLGQDGQTGNIACTNLA